MGIDFHSQENRVTYTTRTANHSWINAIKDLVPIENISKAVDIGCGGGIYSKALSDMGVSMVTGVDFSEPILEGARENCKEYKNISFKHGSAFESGLATNSADLLLERALIHHFEDLPACFDEAYRILKEDGFYIVQDRTPADCLIEGSDTHIRGYFFEVFPRLMEKETKRRHDSQTVVEGLRAAGFKDIQEITLWETRKLYETRDQLLQDLSERTGRSILHELDNNELKLLLNHIDEAIKRETNIVEKDRWTIWKAVK
ncbi:methyltransferase domain-containing protein [Neobacillus pocheonensis]|uniref:class I SAM-dependent methyltransferase n=1 Tax=Neobacillus pocheonensis TaxID=363869 RepID=UPI003D2BB458